MSMNLYLNCVSKTGEHIDSFSLNQTPSRVTWEILGEGNWLQTGVEPYLSRYTKWRNPPKKIGPEDKEIIRGIMLKNGFEDYQVDFIVDRAINEDSEIEHVEELNCWIEKNKDKGIIEWSAQ